MTRSTSALHTGSVHIKPRPRHSAEGPILTVDGRWQVGRLRFEAGHGDRIVSCYADRPANFGTLIEEAIRVGGEREAVVAHDGRLTWQQLGKWSDSVAHCLQRDGIKRGDRIALSLSNGTSFVVALIAALRIGVTVVPINIREQREEIAHIVNDSDCAAVIFGPESQAQLPTHSTCPGVRLWVDQGGHFFSKDTAAPIPIEKIAEHELAFIFYTSGTTGRPKGAMLTHANVVHSVLNFTDCLQLSAEDRMLVAVPMSHVTGLIGMIATAICAKATLLVMQSFDVADFITFASAERATHTILVPAMYNLILLRADLKLADLQSWRIGGYGGAPMPASTIARIADALPDLQLWNLYGATETTSAVTMLPPRFAISHGDSVGFPAPGATILVMDRDGRELPPGEIGELWIGGPTVAQGYWNNPDATHQSFTAGFWKSGDIGSIEDDGFVRVLDRAKDLINRGGYKIFSAEVESVLSTHPEIVEAAIVPKYCAVLGERVHAFVTMKEGSKVSAEDLDAFVQDHLADFKRPESWTISGSPLPRNANGKILKRPLRDIVAHLFPTQIDRQAGSRIGDHTSKLEMRDE